MNDETFEVKERIWSAVHDLVDAMTCELPEDEDTELRQVLTEQFRFWRRIDK